MTLISRMETDPAVGTQWTAWPPRRQPRLLYEDESIPRAVCQPRARPNRAAPSPSMAIGVRHRPFGGKDARLSQKTVASNSRISSPKRSMTNTDAIDGDGAALFGLARC